QVLANVLAGLLLLSARPIRIGSRITFSGWQYGFTFPSYPPKFFSDNSLIPGFTGIVEDITLNYTLIQEDSGNLVKVPNSVVITMALIDQEVSERIVRIRYEAQKPIDAKALLQVAEKVAKTNEWVTNPEKSVVYVENITANSVLISLEAVCRGSREEPPRSSILVELDSEVAKMRAAR
ncbi:MAG: mechanosensitive ion channel family protein, partial [Thermoprotei archaeon]